MPLTRSRISACVCRLLPSRLVRRFVRQQDGAAAVEFGLVALPFLGLTAVCNHIYGLFDCANGIYVDVKSYTSFSAITNDPPITDGKLDPSKINYSPGDVGNIEVVTLYYQWPIYVSLLGNNLSNINANTRLLVSTAVFRNEPYH